MKLHGRNVMVTLGLLLVLFLVVLVEIIIFISGPNLRYEDKVASQEAVIKETYKDVKDLQRHVFTYIMYIGEDDQKVYWFNENGEVLTSHAKTELQMEEAARIAKETYGMEHASIQLGYGYDNPVYILDGEKAEVYLDFATLKEVWNRQKG